MSQTIIYSWNTANFTWNGNPYLWNYVVKLLTQPGGPTELSELDRNHLRNLSKTVKDQIVSIYVEAFKDYMDEESRQLAERAGVRLITRESKKRNKKISVTATERGASTPLVEVVARIHQITTEPKITLTALCEILDIDINKEN